MLKVSVAILAGASAFVGAQLVAAQSEPAGAAVSREQIHCFVAGGCADKAAPPATSAKPQEDSCMETGDCTVGETKGFHLTTGAPAVSASRPSATSTARTAAPARTAYAAAASTARVGRTAMATPAARQSLNMRLSFELNSSQLTPEARQRADMFASELKSATGPHRFDIEGHTDNVGNPAYNQRLSRERAQAVVDYLVAQGVPASKLHAVGYGFAHPVDGAAASDPGNRRVEITRD